MGINFINNNQREIAELNILEDEILDFGFKLTGSSIASKALCVSSLAQKSRGRLRKVDCHQLPVEISRKENAPIRVCCLASKILSLG